MCDEYLRLVASRESVPISVYICKIDVTIALLLGVFAIEYIGTILIFKRFKLIEKRQRCKDNVFFFRKK